MVTLKLGEEQEIDRGHSNKTRIILIVLEILSLIPSSFLCASIKYLLSQFGAIISGPKENWSVVHGITKNDRSVLLCLMFDVACSSSTVSGCISSLLSSNLYYCLIIPCSKQKFNLTKLFFYVVNSSRKV